MNKLNNLSSLMAEHDLDALISTSSENSMYVGDIWTLAPPLVRGNPVCTILFRDNIKESIIVSPIGLFDLFCENQSWITDIRLYGSFFVNHDTTPLDQESKYLQEILTKETYPSIFHVLSAIISERKLKGRIGIDENNFNLSQFQILKTKLSGVKLVEAGKIFHQARKHKFNDEINHLEKAVEITEYSWTQTLEKLKEGTTEFDMLKIYQHHLIEKNAEPYFQVLALGERSAFPNAPPSGRTLQKGDIVRLDGGCEYKRYKADIARIAVYGSPTQKIKKYYKAILEGEEAAINKIKPGVKCSDLFKVAVQTVRNTGIPHYQRHHCGHGIGLEFYDPPLISPHDHTKIEEGMVLNIETPYYELGFGGLQVEDTVLVTESGVRYLTKSSRELSIL